jgi:hypothetical protein
MNTGVGDREPCSLYNQGIFLVRGLISQGILSNQSLLKAHGYPVEVQTASVVARL